MRKESNALSPREICLGYSWVRDGDGDPRVKTRDWGLHSYLKQSVMCHNGTGPEWHGSLRGCCCCLQNGCLAPFFVLFSCFCGHSKWQLLSLCGNFGGRARKKRRAAEAVEVNDVATCFLLVLHWCCVADDDGRPAVAVATAGSCFPLINDFNYMPRSRCACVAPIRVCVQGGAPAKWRFWPGQERFCLLSYFWPRFAVGISAIRCALT